MVLRHRGLIGTVSVVVLVSGLVCLLLLPRPWNEAAFAAALVWEVGHILFFVWYSKRGRAQVGIQTLIGQSALVVTACFPTGQVRLGGETWIAHCETGASVGQKVHVQAVDGLTLLVEHEEASKPLSSSTSGSRVTPGSLTREEGGARPASDPDRPTSGPAVANGALWRLISAPRGRERSRSW
jgi:membrane protein implicated in regulation of membrane protease activity